MFVMMPVEELNEFGVVRGESESDVLQKFKDGAEKEGGYDWEGKWALVKVVGTFEVKRKVEIERFKEETK